ncbi:hypothetical protein K6W36_11490 [Acetobacter senegalensis]|uniref:hypothetical protein n=1 Tax=Acetobacter senegalensis TaxID=446692 RepID=UPI001EDB5F0E|nr:hypothetical protein [Acetobacter senegalensis]MCG4261189.1 hypothetical protein [Acetobacter senegalensis]
MILAQFSAQEHQKLLDAEKKYGNAFINAYNTTILVSNLMMGPVADCDLFIRFYSQMTKYHLLSVISTVRMHRIQAKIDLRYFLESTANAAFSLAHSDTENYFDFQNEQIGNAQSATKKAYGWLETTYKEHSDFIKELKSTINEQTAHANVVNSQHNFDFIPGERAEIVTSYFDFEDDEMVKLDLWLAAKAGIYAADLILKVQKDSGGFLLSNDVTNLPNLIVDNNSVLAELQNDRR